MSKLGTGYYNLEKYNGEHFASWSVCGAYCSSMIENFDLSRFQKLVSGFDTMNLKSPKNERDEEDIDEVDQPTKNLKSDS